MRHLQTIPERDRWWSIAPASTAGCAACCAGAAKFAITCFNEDPDLLRQASAYQKTTWPDDEP